jgi:transcriptional regulator of aromatic amino acid metabolism
MIQKNRKRYSKDKKVRKLQGLRLTATRYYIDGCETKNSTRFVNYWNSVWSKIKDLENELYRDIDVLYLKYTNKDLAKYYGVSPTSIANALKRRGLSRKGLKQHRSHL